jgi:hypothetical protein
MPILQPPTTPYSPWDIGNFSWASSFIWIPAVIAIIIGVFLLTTYFTKRDTKVLLWSSGFIGIWVLWHQISTSGTYDGLIHLMGTDIFVLPSSALPLLIPGFFAAGLCYDKSKKLGRIYLASLMGLTSIYLAFLAVSNVSEGMVMVPMPPHMGGPAWPILVILAAAIGFLVQGVSVLAIIVLPFLGDNKLITKILMAVAGVIMLFVNTIFSLIALGIVELEAFQNVPEVTIPATDPTNWFAMLVPILLTFSTLLLVFGIIGNKKWGFEFPGVQFEEKE